MNYDRVRALELLRTGSDSPAAVFREDQEDSIRQVVEGRGRLLVVQKTGWGKSFVYFIATRLLREAGSGLALLVSPLLSLMRNQIAAAERMGLRAVTIHSGNQGEWSDVEARVAADEVDILLVSPERFANEGFRERVLSAVAPTVSLLVVDEAHCVSDWGHDFRPHYRLIERIIRSLPPNLRLLATTATANNRVMDDLVDVLGPDLAVLRGDLNRPSLTLQTLRMHGQAERMAWLAETLPTLSGSGIIYALTVRDANLVAEWLRHCGLAVEAYTGQSGNRREELEDALLGNRLKALVATTALGMGFDKPDLAFVIHYQMPGSVVHYYQQVGRAGRALDAAYGVLLCGQEDTDITSWFRTSAFPTRDEVKEVLDVLGDAADGCSIPQLQARVNMSKTRLEKTISLLSLESPAPIVKEGTRWQLTVAEIAETFWSRAERLTSLRQQEHEQMQTYADLPFGAHMPFLIGALDGDPGTATPPTLPPLAAATDPAGMREALEFLRRTNLPIEPRKQWPAGGLPRYERSGSVSPAHRAEPGRALARWGDAGWGELVRRGKYEERLFPDELVAACAEMFEDWSPEPAPNWVTCIPSLRHPKLVPGFAARLASVLGLPFHPVLLALELRPEQKTMKNSIQQARNLDGALGVWSGPVSSDPVLLVDDMVDSRWSLTIAAWLLRAHGSGKVWPLALSDSGSGG